MRNFSKTLAALCVATCAMAMLTGCGDDYYDDDYFGDDYYGDDYYGDDYYDDDYFGDDYYGDEYYDEDGDYGYDDDNYSDYDEYGDESNEGRNSGKKSSTSSVSANFGSLGSASEMAGTTVVVSIYADDKNCSWTSSDQQTKDDSYEYLEMACKWISENAKTYGTDATFIYDWEQNSDLYYETSMSTDLVKDRDDTDSYVWDYIDSNIDSESLMSEYSADNVIYMLFVNAPSSNNVTSSTVNYYDGMDYPYEYCKILMHCDGEEENPGSIAHEILHTFGAPDLYVADDDGYNYGVSQELVDYLERTNSNDIMYTTFNIDGSDDNYDEITNDFTELDAYYVGITDSSEMVDEWNLKASQH